MSGLYTAEKGSSELSTPPDVEKRGEDESAIPASSIDSESGRPVPSFKFSVLSLLGCACLGLWCMSSMKAREQGTNTDTARTLLEGGDLEQLSVIEGYWRGVAHKGLRAAVKSGHHGKGKKGKHHGHDGSHGHHDDEHRHPGHGKPAHGHRRPPRFIPPKEAERIFLSVPNNNSVRE